MDKFASDINSAFIESLESGNVKVAEEKGKSYIKSRIREKGFLRKVIEPLGIGQSEVRRNQHDDGVHKLVDLDVDTEAVILNFRSTPKAQYVAGKRGRIDFNTIASKIFEKKQSELISYEMPITKVLEQYAALEIQTKEDKQFYALMLKAIAGDPSRDVASGDATVTRENLAASLKMLHAKQLNTTLLLMTEMLFDDVLGWGSDSVGESLATKITIEGYSSPTLLKRKLAVTNKSDIIDPKHVWHFCEPEFTGRFYILNGLKFEIHMKFGMLQWMSWQESGMGILNKNSVARIRYTG